MTGGEHPFGALSQRDARVIKNEFNLFLVKHISEAVELFSQLLNPSFELRYDVAVIKCEMFICL
ncbi:putative non-specific serine/threonine protein kinase [Helianthus anomalus]